MTLTSDDLESHIVVNVSSTLTNTTVWFVTALCFIVDVQTDIFTVFGRPYYRSCLWYNVSSVCLSVCLSSVTFSIVVKRYVLAKNCLKERIGNQGQKVDFFGRHHISTAAIFLLPVSPLRPPRRPFLP